MPDPLRSIASAVLSDHEIRLFFELEPVDLAAGPRLVMGDMARATTDMIERAGEILPQDQLAALLGRYSDTQIWAKVGTPEAVRRSWPVTSDLHPALQELFSGNQPDLVQFWELTQLGEEMLKNPSKYEEEVPLEARITKKSLRLEFTKVALRRLQQVDVAPVPMIVTINSCSIAAFATGFSLCCVSVSLRRFDRAQLTANELIESVYALSRNSALRWVDATAPDNVCSEAVSLEQIIRLFAKGGADPKKKSRRIDTYVFAQTSDTMDPDGREALASFLCRRYTSDYSLDLDHAGMEMLRDFSNIRHAISVEGAATVVALPDVRDPPHYLENWRTGPFASSYVHLFLLALHEDWFLTKNRAYALKEYRGDEAIDRIDALLEETLIFRLCFRYFSVSKLTMHTLFSQGLRKARLLDRKLDELEGDVAAMSERLGRVRGQQTRADEQARFKAYSRYAIIGGAFLAGLTAWTITQQILDLFPGLLAKGPDPTVAQEALQQQAGEALPKNADRTVTTREGVDAPMRLLLPLIVGSAVTTLACVIGFRYRLPAESEPNESRLSIRTMTLKMLRGALGS